jgi:hypothetical protein
MQASDLIRATVGVVLVYLALMSSAVLYRYGRLSKQIATLIGASIGIIISLVAFAPRFEPLGPSLIAMVVGTAAAAIATRYVVIILDRVFGRS